MDAWAVNKTIAAIINDRGKHESHRGRSYVRLVLMGRLTQRAIGFTPLDRKIARCPSLSVQIYECNNSIGWLRMNVWLNDEVLDSQRQKGE